VLRYIFACGRCEGILKGGVELLVYPFLKLMIFKIKILFTNKCTLLLNI